MHTLPGVPYSFFTTAHEPRRPIGGLVPGNYRDKTRNLPVHPSLCAHISGKKRTGTCIADLGIIRYVTVLLQALFLLILILSGLYQKFNN